MIALPDHHIVTLRGRDAATFAQAQFMSDVLALADGHWQWSGWLTPKGRVIALFALLKTDAETIRLVLQDADPAQFASRLQGFVFRSKLAIEADGPWSVSGAFEAYPGAAGSQAAPTGDDGFALDVGGAGGPRSLFMGTAIDAAEDTDALARWTAFDLGHGLPRLAASQSEQWTPQQLSLERLRAYSVKKGCYPGQEIVARTHFLGQAKRGLALFECDAPLEAGQQVMDGDRALGTIASAVASGRQHIALAVLPLEPVATAPAADGHLLRPRALQDGLAR